MGFFCSWSYIERLFQKHKHWPSISQELLWIYYPELPQELQATPSQDTCWKFTWQEGGKIQPHDACLISVIFSNFCCHFSFIFCLSIIRASPYNEGANGSWICLQAEVVSLFLTCLLSRAGPHNHKWMEFAIIHAISTSSFTILKKFPPAVHLFIWTGNFFWPGLSE